PLLRFPTTRSVRPSAPCGPALIAAPSPGAYFAIDGSTRHWRSRSRNDWRALVLRAGVRPHRVARAAQHRARSRADPLLVGAGGDQLDLRGARGGGPDLGHLQPLVVRSGRPAFG